MTKKSIWRATILAAALSAAPAYAAAQSSGWGAVTGGDEEPDATEAAGPTASSTDEGQASGGDTDSRLADAAAKYREAVGVVVMTVPNRGPTPVGTAWAFEDRRFATNAHVAKIIKDTWAKHPYVPFFVAINGRPDKRLKVSSFSMHPEYGKADVRFDGKVASRGYDIAVLTTDAAAPAHFNLADQDDLKKLRSGTRIAYLGFPMERLLHGNVDAQMPVATMQSGIVTSMSDHFLADSGFEKNRLVRHNLAATGGASGSPIFTSNGDVVAILYAGNVIGSVSVDAQSGEASVVRAPNAALVNFAERIDSLAGVPRK
ncbi:MAG: trypsin-like serine peptidase [Parvularculaceae bacterium]